MSSYIIQRIFEKMMSLTANQFEQSNLPSISIMKTDSIANVCERFQIYMESDCGINISKAIGKISAF